MMPITRLASFNKFISQAALLLVMLLPSACAVKFTYNQLDWLIPWYLDDYVTLTSDQEAIFASRLERYLKFHRSDQLPLYADFLDSIAVASRDGFNLAELEQIQAKKDYLSDALLVDMAPLLADLIPYLVQQQIDEFFRNLETRNDRFKDKYIEVDENDQRREQAKKIRKRVERWSGDLDEEQIEKIGRWSREYQLMGAEYLQSRLAWQQRLKPLLQKRNDKEYLEKSLRELLATSRLRHSKSSSTKYQYNRQLLNRLYLSLYRSFSDEQRNYMLKQLTSYAQDFRDLAKQSINIPGNDVKPGQR